MKSYVKTLREPDKGSHKGENGKLLIVGGSKEYHGAPMLSILAARRFVDLVYFCPGEEDSFLISAVKTIPEVIVVDGLKKIDEVDCVLSGVGLGKAKFSARLFEAKKLVVDGDGLKRIKDRIPKGAIITPHEGEFRMLFGVEGNKKNVKEMAKEHECIILKKGPVDIISDGNNLVTNDVHNPGMTKGGTGDVLAGLVAALACKNDSFDAAVAAAIITGYAGNMLQNEYGYNFCASDVAEALAESFAKLRK
jgi:NAD(P)H-hydrate epimerase